MTTGICGRAGDARLRRGAKSRGQTAEEAGNRHACDALDKALTDARNQAADFRRRIHLNFCSRRDGLEEHMRGSMRETWFAGRVDGDSIGVRRRLVRERHDRAEDPRYSPDAKADVGVIAVIANRPKLATASKTRLDRIGIHQHDPDLFGCGGKIMCVGELHAVGGRAAVDA
jgi:hypothetical protein